jgi:choline dehydrogenase-like flavoprotein
LLTDARTVPKNKNIHTDVCIVGAGAAGITLARELVGQSFQVVLVESGGLEFDLDTQTLYKGEVSGLPYSPLDASRLRFFGGTTNHWVGWCRPLDDLDFEARDWVPHSGWPFTRSEILPYYERAQRICQLGKFAYNAPSWHHPDAPPLPLAENRVVTNIYQFSPPTRFGQVYRQEILGAKNLHTFLHANVVDIEVAENVRSVKRMAIACLNGNRFSIQARVYILACGGIENARLLLASNKVQKAGLGNEHDLVGRFFMDHAGLVEGAAIIADPMTATTLHSFSEPEISSGLYRRYSPEKLTDAGGSLTVRGALAVSPDVQRHERLGNFSALLLPSTLSDAFSPKPPVKKLVRHHELGGLLKYVADVASNLDEFAATAYRRLANRDATPRVFQLVNVIEPVPNPNSRVTLLDERDQLGLPRVRLNWQLSAQDKVTIRRSQEIIGQALGAAGLGRLMLTMSDQGDSWPETLEHGWHNIGTTRMHIDPKRGVVNPHGQVHGTSNLFIAGSSVFPTAGYSPPTLTIVALAVRLADHIKKRLG